MDEIYLSEKPKNWGVILLVAGAVALILGGILFWISQRQKLISPLPSEPTFEVIFYTPTPAPVTPTSTPSATPKVKKTPTKAPTPTVKAATATATPKPSPSPTVAPTP